MNRRTLVTYFLFPFALGLALCNLAGMGIAAHEYRAWDADRAHIERDLDLVHALEHRLDVAERRLQAAEGLLSAHELDILSCQMRAQHLRASLLHLVRQQPGVERLPRPLAGSTWPPWPIDAAYDWDPDGFIRQTLEADRRDQR